MIIPCIAMETEVCQKCIGLGRKEPKFYSSDTSWIDIIVDKEGQCERCKGKGWNVTSYWRYAELLD